MTQIAATTYLPDAQDKKNNKKAMRLTQIATKTDVQVAYKYEKQWKYHKQTQQLQCKLREYNKKPWE